MKRLIDLAIKNPYSVIAIFLIPIFCGIFSLIFIKKDFLPEIKNQSVKITTIYPFIDSEIVEQTVTIPLERALSSLSGLKEINSSSHLGMSIINLKLENRDNLISTQIKEIVDKTYNTMPKKVIRPKIELSKQQEIPIAVLSFQSSNKSLQDGGINLYELSKLARKDILTNLQIVDGVGKIEILGDINKEIEIKLSEEKFRTQNISISSIYRTFEDLPKSSSAGVFEKDNKEYPIKFNNNLNSIKDIENIFLSDLDNVRIKNIAEVSFKTSPQTSLFFNKEKEAIGFKIFSNGDLSPNILSKNIERAVAEISKKYEYKNLELKIVENNSSKLKNSTKKLFLTALIAFFTSSTITYLFLKDFRLMIISLITYPISILFSVTGLYIFGFSVNTITITGLITGIGMVIDNSIIVVEKYEAQKQKEKIDYILNTIKPLIASTLTTIIVFLPPIFITGPIGIFFKDFSIAISLSIFGSLLTAFFLIPALLKLTENYNPKTSKNKSFRNLENRYKSSLNKIFSKKKLSLIISFSILFFSILLIPFLKYSPVPQYKTKNYTATKIVDSNIKTSELRKILSKELHTIFKNIEKNNTYIYYQKDVDKNKIFVKSNNKKLKTILEKNNYTIHNNKSIISSLLLIDNLQPTLILEKEIDKSFIEKNIVEEYKINEDKIIEIIPKYRELKQKNIQKSEIKEDLKASTNGLLISEINRDEEVIPIIVRISNNKNIENYLIKNSFKLSTISDINKNKKVKIRYRKNGIKVFIYKIKDLKTLKKEFSSRKDYKIVSASDIFKEKKSLIFAILIFSTIILILLLIAIFESIKAPFLIFTTTVFSIAGVSISVFIFRETINFFSLTALITLIGISVNSGIFMFEKLNNKANTDRRNIKTENIIDSASKRLRAILITSLTTIIALIPSAFNIIGRNDQSSPALIIVGGMLSSTLFSLFIFPLLYKIFFKKENLNE